MKFSRALLLALLSVVGLNAANTLAIRDLSGSTQTGRPFTFGRYFAQGEIAEYAQPRVSGVTPSAWQCDRQTTWPDGSLKFALISFRTNLAANNTVTIDFVNSANPSSAGDATATAAAGLDQAAMLAFNGGGWGAKFSVTANPQGTTTTATRSARTILGAGNWTYRLRGPVVTQVVVEDASVARSYDFGWKQKRMTSLSASIATAIATTFTVIDGSDLAALTPPFDVQIGSENLTVTGVSGNTVTATRGVNGTTAAVHNLSAADPILVISKPITRLAADLTAGVGTAAILTATVEDASGIAIGDVIQIDQERLRVCNKSGNVLSFGGGSLTACDATALANAHNFRGRAYDGTNLTSNSTLGTAHTQFSFVSRPADSDMWSDAPIANYKSLHPQFILTFYAGYASVKEEFILENMWADRRQDQYYDVTLYNGGSETTSAWSWSNVKHIPLSRWRHTVWDGATPAAVNIDHNLTYLASTGLLPYDTSIAINASAINSELTYPQFSQGGFMPSWADGNQCQPDTFGASGYLNKLDAVKPIEIGTGTVVYLDADGLMERHMPDPGGRGEIGLFPRWDATWLYAMGSSLSQATQIEGVALGMAECSAHVPLHYREYDNTRLFCNAGSSTVETTKSCTGANASVSAYARPVSVDARPSFVPESPANTDAADRISVGVGPITTSQWQVGGGSIGHSVSNAFLPYMLTGDLYFLQELQYWAAFDIADAAPFPNQVAPSLGPTIKQRSSYRHRDWGYCDMSDGFRGQAWCMRDIGFAALASPDGTPDKQYYKKKLDVNIAILEGKYNITTGTYYNDQWSAASPNTTYDKSYWTFGRQYKGIGASNPLHFDIVPYEWMGTGRNDSSYNYVYTFYQPFMYYYGQVVWGYLDRLGFTEISPLRKVHAELLVNELANPDVPNHYVVEGYTMPATPCKPEGTSYTPDCSTQTFAVGDNLYYQTYASWYQAVSGPRKASNSSFTSQGDMISGYAVLARAASAFALDVVDPATGIAGSDAWTWINGHVTSIPSSCSATPMWCFSPQFTPGAPPPPPGALVPGSTIFRKALPNRFSLWRYNRSQAKR